MFEAPHPLPDVLEDYALGRTSESAAEKVEIHLLYCGRCQDELSRTEEYIRAMKSAAAEAGPVRRLRSLHFTSDGPIFGAIHPLPNGKWMARHWGKQLQGGTSCSTLEEANAYLLESFQQMFPEHVCLPDCIEEL